jgi:hypothetical protein
MPGWRGRKTHTPTSPRARLRTRLHRMGYGSPKRAAFLSIGLFLAINAIRSMLAVASGELDEEGLAATKR